ncbi:peptidoglycan hydrolase PcsB [Streptococcus halichoeri]|uniref:peptidoglycan hydrolase PcsB n=1 Tax=Streptococcus halichoeri TaxID=254785 RepID=UPI00135A2D13|nr:CHAP domain-containing protein [Streptococcus halichoeri]
MKKRILSAVLVSGVTLGAATVVSADNIDVKISDADKKISNLTSQQQAASKQVNALQSQVSALQSEQDSLAAQNAELKERSKQYEQEIQALTNQIVARNEKLEKQARSAQRGNQSTNYINTLLNSKSISDAVTRLFAINRAVSANAKLLEQQKADKAALLEKQEANQEAINTVAANVAKIEENQNALQTQKADLEAATVKLALELASANDDKASLVAQKEAAEKAAAEAAKAEAAAKAKAEEQAKAQAASVVAAQEQLAKQSSTAPTAAPSSLVAPAAQAAAASTASVQPRARRSAPVATPTSYQPSISYGSAGTYPVGQCTWGVKSMAPWVGDYWGNGAQWANSARAAGFSVGSTPRVGAVAVWGGGFGHVALVTSVESDSNIQVMESNYNGNQSIGNYRGWFNPTSQGTVEYIYPH